MITHDIDNNIAITIIEINCYNKRRHLHGILYGDDILINNKSIKLWYEMSLLLLLAESESGRTRKLLRMNFDRVLVHSAESFVSDSPLPVKCAC